MREGKGNSTGEDSQGLDYNTPQSVFVQVPSLCPFLPGLGQATENNARSQNTRLRKLVELWQPLGHEGLPIIHWQK